MRKENPQKSVRPDRLATLVRRLAETSKSLQSLLADEVDAVLFPGGESFLLLPAQTRTRLAVEMQRTILDAIPAHLTVLDREGKIIFMNESWQRFLRQSEGPWKSLEIGQNYVDYCERANHAYGSIPHKVATGIRQVLNVEAHTFNLVHQVLQQGQNKWYRMTVTSLGGAETSGAVVMYQDVTEQQLATEKILEQAVLLEQAEDAILVQDMQGRIEYWNNSATKLHGWEAIEVLGRCADDFLYEDSGSMKEIWAILLGSGAWHGELKKLTKDGRVLTFQSRWTLVRDAADNPKSVLSIDTDVTMEKKFEEQVLRVQRLESIGTLAGGIAHDLNNMLLPILVSAEMLRSRLKDPANRELAETIETSAKRGADMVRRVLAFARGSEANWTRISPLAVVKEIAITIENTFLRQVELVTHISANIWSVFGDPTEVYQVLLNLADNARDAMPEGGTLAISVTNVRLEEHDVSLTGRAAGAYVRFAVSDTGSGISPQTREKIFDPFFTTKEFGNGTGLGLSTALGIVKSYRGFMNLTSEVGRGSNFEFYLPADFSASSSLGKLPQIKLPRGDGELVLVIDDEASIRQVVRQTLETFGYLVVTAESGAEALSIYAQRKTEIAAVITDMMMPMMSGVATTEALLRLNPEVKIIIVTGFVTDAQKKSAMTAGAREFLAKPFTIEKLLATLARVLPSPAVGASAR